MVTLNERFGASTFMNTPLKPHFSVLYERYEVCASVSKCDCKILMMFLIWQRKTTWISEIYLSALIFYEYNFNFTWLLLCFMEIIVGSRQKHLFKYGTCQFEERKLQPYLFIIVSFPIKYWSVFQYSLGLFYYHRLRAFHTILPENENTICFWFTKFYGVYSYRYHKISFRTKNVLEFKNSGNKPPSPCQMSVGLLSKHIKNRLIPQGIQSCYEMPGYVERKHWYMGRYYGNRARLFLAS